MKRRTMLLAGLAGTGLGVLGLRPADRGENHSVFFQQLSHALDSGGISTPTLIIDRKQMLQNLAVLQSHLDQRFDYRIVAKSLPSLDLLEVLMGASGSRRLMLFHQPFINQVAVRFPDTDVLLGKPLPVAAAAKFYEQLEQGTFDPSRQLHWLIDTVERAQQYAELADTLNVGMSVVLEIDVGLHRGGARDTEELRSILSQIQASQKLSFAGLMGYEPHIVKVPGDAAGYRDLAMARYEDFLNSAREFLGADFPSQPILNAGGSPTYQMYNEGSYPFNELAAGSCLVKPTDFDLPTLADHQPASWIAAPVLKSMDTLTIPGINLGPLQSLWDPNRERSFFTYGGWWKAEPESPSGLQINSLFGRSTNQEMLNGSSSIDLEPDDWVFLRPTQSEFVFLQFGDIAVLDGGKITERWPVLSAQV